MQFHQHCLKTLQQRVVQLPRDACPLGKPLFKTNLEQLSQLTHSQAVHEQRRQSGANYTAQLKPPGLPKRGLNFEPDHSLRTVPQPIAVAGDNTESIRPYAKIVVRGFPACRWFTPSTVKAVQTVSISHALRIAETQPHVAKRRPSRAREKVNGASAAQRCAVSRNALDVHQSRSRSRSSRCPCRIHQ